jgi:putative Holliday junction resolvase
MRIMAIDFGDAHTGVAISDPLGMLAGTAITIDSWSEDVVLERICQMVKENKVEELVLGHPVNMDGTRGPRAEKYEAFGQRLREATGLNVVLWDERRTSVEAHQILSSSGKKTKKHKAKVDAVAATLILEGYLTFKRMQG